MVTDREMAHTRTMAEMAHRSSPTVITDARMGTSEEMSSRIRRYTITMAFRTACFISMIFVQGLFRWVLFACAVVLPSCRGRSRRIRPISTSAPVRTRAPNAVLGGGPSSPPVTDDAQSGEVIDERGRRATAAE